MKRAETSRETSRTAGTAPRCGSYTPLVETPPRSDECSTGLERKKTNAMRDVLRSPTLPSASVAWARPLLALASGLLALGCAGAPAMGPGVADVAVGAIDAPAPTEPSAADRAPARDAADAPGAFAFVTKLGASHWLILAAGAADLAASDPVYLTDPASSMIALEAKVPPPQLDPSIRLEKRSFDLWQGSKKVCSVTAGRTRLIGVTATPHELMTSVGEGETPAAPTAKEVWPYARYYLAAPIDVPRDCDASGAWARLAELPEPRFATLRSLPPAAAGAPSLEVELTAAFRASPSWGHAQAQFVASRDGGDGSVVGTWEEAGSSGLEVWDAPFLGSAIAVRQAAWDEGCGASATVTMAFRIAPSSVNAASKPTVQFEGEDRFDVDLVLDLDRDGKLEMIGTDAWGRTLRPMWGADHEVPDRQEILSYTVPEHGCGC